MTTVLKSASNATVALFDTVTHTADAASKTVDGMMYGATMFERMMAELDKDHQDRVVVHRLSYRKELMEDAARETSKRQAEIQKEMQEDEHYAKLYAENYTELEAAFAEK